MRNISLEKYIVLNHCLIAVHASVFNLFKFIQRFFTEFHFLCINYLILLYTSLITEKKCFFFEKYKFRKCIVIKYCLIAAYALVLKLYKIIFLIYLLLNNGFLLFSPESVFVLKIGLIITGSSRNITKF